MKTYQLFGALAAVVLVVFGVTFLRNYVGPAPANDEPTSTAETADLPTLTIPIRLYPYMARNGMPVGHYELEHKKPGHQDYWFVNENDTSIHVGAKSKSCKCQGVDIFILPEGYKARPPLPEPLPVFGLPLGILGRAAYSELIEDRATSRDLEAKAEKFVALNPEDPNAEIDIPPHRAGWVRMKWTGEKAGAQNLVITLWTHHPGSGAEIVLERKATFLDPVRITGDERLGVLRMHDLPKGYFFYVWSSTRNSFTITKADAIRSSAIAADSDAFEVGQPVPLSAEERRALQMIINKGEMLSGYRVPLTLRRLARDGKTPFELGNFRRQIEVLTDAQPDKVLSLTFTGIVLGDVQINGVDDSGGISFGNFPKDSLPQPRVISFRGEAPDLKLELDTTRVPEFLQATLLQDTGGDEASRAWKLEVKLRPGVYGTFPRDDDPAYRDSAIYLRTVGTAPQYIRIGVRGDAVDR
jgi:hypothetical protein